MKTRIKTIILEKKIIQSFNDLYYKGILKEDLSMLNTTQILFLLSKYIIIFDYDYSDDTIITDDEIFERCNEENLSIELHKTPLINPTNEYEIEYKFLYLYNFMRKRKSEKRDDLDYLFSTNSPDWQRNNIFENIIVKT